MPVNVPDEIFYGTVPPMTPVLPPAPIPPPAPAPAPAPSPEPILSPQPLPTPGHNLIDVGDGTLISPPAATPQPAPVSAPTLEPAPIASPQPLPTPGHNLIDVGDGTLIAPPLKTPAEGTVAPPPPGYYLPDGGEVDYPPDEPPATHENQGEEFMFYELSDLDGIEVLGNRVLRGMAFVNYVRQRADALQLDELAVFAEAYNEGMGGGIGDSGHSYGPWQLYTGGRLPRIYSKYPPYSAQVNAWAWSEQGIDYAMRGMAGTAAKGKHGLDAVTILTRDYEAPANWEAQNLVRQRTYEQLSRLGGGAWTFLAGIAAGPKGAPAAPPAAPTPAPQPSGLTQNWRALIAVLRDDVPAAGTHLQNTARRLNKAVS